MIIYGSKLIQYIFIDALSRDLTGNQPGVTVELCKSFGYSLDRFKIEKLSGYKQVITKQIQVALRSLLDNRKVRVAICVKKYILYKA